jgi:UDP-3-O-[3-hydroxymyristoyl] glucosamine N-acyltransferase
MDRRNAKMSELASILELELLGQDTVIKSLGYSSSFSEYGAKLTYCSDKRFLKKAFNNSSVAGIILKKDLVPNARLFPLPIILSFDPISDFYRLHNYLYLKTAFYKRMEKNEIGNSQIHSSAIIESSVKIGNNVRVGPFSVINKGTILEDDVIIGAGTIIGASGFEAKRIDGKYKFIEHAGGTVIRNGARIGSNSVVARNLFEGFSEIGPYSQVDSMVHISHNVRIGSNCLVCSGANIAGSSQIGDDCFISVGAVVSNGVCIADNSTVNIGAVVVQDTKTDQEVSGFYAIDNQEWLMKTIVDKKNLAKIIKQAKNESKHRKDHSKYL